MDAKTAIGRAESLVAQMTTEEAASQLRYNAPAIDRLGIPSYNWWNEALHGVARAGTATVFPQAIGLAAAFDDGLIFRIAGAIADEGRSKYNMQRKKGDRGIYKGLTFWSPNINIFRDPRWGRGQETYGEDPFLTARLGVSFVKGLQGDGRYMKAAACAKHYAVHSGPEDERHSFDARVSLKDLRETYLPAFEALVREAKVESVMGAYNRVNGEPSCGSSTLLARILRGEWGFEGHVVSDCWAIADFHTGHMVTSTAPESAAMALKAGCDLNCGNMYLNLLIALQEGLIEERDIRGAAVRVMATRFKLGMFDDDCEYDAIPYEVTDCDAHAALSLCAARRSMVLLKNNGVLPLRRDRIKRIAVIGPNADCKIVLDGNYSGTSSRYVTFLEGIRAAAAPGTRVTYAEGCHLFKDRVTGLSDVPDDRLAEAVAQAELSDAAILCLGLNSQIEGEEGDAGNEYGSGDKPGLELPAPQRRLIEAVRATGVPMVVILAAGSALSVSDADAILCAWYPGQAGGVAAAEILFGDTCPSGRLPVTFYKSVDDLPDFKDYSMKNRTYRYFMGEPLYPFGFGLSYARFEYTYAAFEGTPESGGIISVTVKNRSAIGAEEVIEAYIEPLNSKDAPPNPCLCAFKRVSLVAGAEEVFSLQISPAAFTVVDERGNRVLPGGPYKIYIGGSQPDPVSVRLTGVKPLRVNIP